MVAQICLTSFLFSLIKEHLNCLHVLSLMLLLLVWSGTTPQHPAGAQEKPTSGGADEANEAPEKSSCRVGVAAVKITPQKPVVLAGYASRTKPHERVDQELWAKALAFQDAEGERAVLVTIDLCILPTDVAEEVRKRIIDNAAHPIREPNVLLSVSHTHSAPAVSLNSKPSERGQVNATSEGTAEYTRWLQDRLVEVAIEALSDMSAARLSWGTGIAHFAMNRRQFTEKGVILGVNPRGPVDRTVPVLRVDASDGKPVAVLFGYACHCTTVPSNHLGISADFPGYAREYIQKQYPGVEAMFIAGCGGDANPYPRQQPEHAALLGEQLGKEVCRVMETQLQRISGPLSCRLEYAELPLQTLDRKALQAFTESGSNLQKQNALEMLAELDAGKEPLTTYRTPVTAWQFDADLTLIALPNDVVVDYVPLIEAAVGPLKLWVAGYCHEVAGYIPSRRVLREGGYETRGLYVGTGSFAPEPEDVLVDAVWRAAEAAGRSVPRASH